nr:MAG TPA: hypothetical protein [Caudoviricetes sp.]
MVCSDLSISCQASKNNGRTNIIIKPLMFGNCPPFF